MSGSRTTCCRARCSDTACPNTYHTPVPRRTNPPASAPQLHSAEEARQKMTLAGSSDAATEEKLKQMHKEMEEQETLIRGFQQVWWGSRGQSPTPVPCYPTIWYFTTRRMRSCACR